MKQFDKVINEKLSEKKFSLNEAHLAAFEVMLDRKPKRRNAFRLWFLGLSFLGIGLFVFGIIMLPKLNFNRAEGSIVVDKSESSESVLERSLGVAKGLASDIAENRMSGTNKSEINQLETEKSVLVNTESKNVISEKINFNTEKINSIKTKPDKIFQSTPILENIHLVKMDSKEANIDGVSRENQDENVPEIKKVLTEEILVKYDPVDVTRLEVDISTIPYNARLQQLNSNAFQNRSFSFSQKPIIKYRKNIHIGLAARSGLSQTHGGIFVYLPLNRSLVLIPEVGISHQWNNIDFEKSSVISRPGFGARNTTNTLSIKKLYQYYAGMELGYRIDRHMLAVGGRATYIYGAKGDLTVFTSQDFGPDQSSTQTNVWVSTKGLNRISTRMTASYFYQINRRIQLGCGIEIPIIGSTSFNSQDVISGYILDSKKESISANLGLRLYLFK